MLLQNCLSFNNGPTPASIQIFLAFPISECKLYNKLMGNVWWGTWVRTHILLAMKLLQKAI